MHYVSTSQEGKNDFWFNRLLLSCEDKISNVHLNTYPLKDIDLEINISFGTFFCQEDKSFFIDTSKPSNHQVSVLYLKNPTNENFDFLINKPIINYSTDLLRIAPVHGYVFDFQSKMKYDYFCISFHSKKIDNKKLDFSFSKLQFSHTIQELKNTLLFNKTVNISRAKIACHQIFNILSHPFGRNDVTEILIDDPKEGPIYSYEKLIIKGFKIGIFDSNELLKHFQLNPNKVEREIRGTYSQTFKQYFTKKKIEYSYVLISKQGLNIQEATHLIGYKSSNYLYSKLKRQYGRNFLKTRLV